MNSINAAFRDAAGRVLENVLTQFEELSKDDLEKLLNTNVKFLVNDHMRNITNNTLQKDIESFDYTKRFALFRGPIEHRSI